VTATAGRRIVPPAEATPPLYAGIDLGGTNIKAALVDDAGRLVAFHTEPTHADRGPEDTAARMGGTVHALARQAGIATADIARVGLGTPGPQDLPRGMILRAGNLPGWDNFPIRDRVAAHCGRDVTYANDANAAAYGEFWVGSGREYSSLVLLTLGTGVGGGIIIGDTNVEGAHSHGSECGHIIVDTSPTARTCPFGHRGDLEAYASATALVAAARAALAAGGRGPLSDAVAGGEALSPILVARAAAAGDQLALDLILDAARWLGIGIVTLMHTIDPAAVILGGAMTFGGEADPIGRAFLERIRAEVRARAFPVLAEQTVIRYAELGGDAGSIGAAGLARIAHRRG
jgi:glucokinase